MLLATILDGSDQGDGHRVIEKRCGLCGAFQVRFVASAGLVASCGVEPQVETCVNAKAFLGRPCVAAIRAAPLLDALKSATKR